MAKRKKGYEYLDAKTKDANGKPIITHTLTVVLYAPDGSIFHMPHGGDPANYLMKGFKSSPDDIWREKNAEYERVKDESLKISNMERETKEKLRDLESKRESLENKKKLEALEARLAEEQARLEAEIEADRNGTELPVETNNYSEPTPAPAKKKAGRPKKAKQ